MATITFVSVFDCGGRNQVWCNIINELTTHRAYNVVQTKTYLDHGRLDGCPDIIKDDSRISQIIKETDIIVACPGLADGCWDPALPPCIHDGPFLSVGTGKTWAELGKPIIIFLYGSFGLRAHYAEFHKAFDRWPTWCFDADIAIDGKFKIAPLLAWFPWAERHFPTCPPIRICHTATDRRVKNTNELLSVCEELGGIEVDVISGGIPLRNTIQKKANSHINFDHLQGYYGNSSFEALSLGVPNIVGCVDHRYHGVIKDAWSSETIPPWHLCQNVQDLRILLKRFKEHPEEILMSAKEHLWWWHTYFKPIQILERFIFNII